MARSTALVGSQLIRSRALRSLPAAMFAATMLCLPASSAAGAPPEPTEPSTPTEDAAPDQAPTTDPVGGGSDGTGIVIDGYRSDYTQTFVIPYGRQPSGPGTARAQFRIPDLVVDAVVTASLNDVAIGSWLLGSGPSVADIEMALPADSLVVGTNRLRLETVTPLSIDGSCRESSHPARWLELASAISVEVATTPGDRLRLADFPEALRNTLDTTTILVGATDGPHLTAAATIGAAISDAFGRDHTLVVTTSPGDVVGALVTIGVDATRHELAITADDDGQVELRVAATDGTDLTQLARAISQPGARARMTRSTIDGVAAIDLVAELVPTVRQASDEWLAGMSLDDLGYGTAFLEGPGVDRATYTVDVPLGDLASFMTITVDAVPSASGPEWDPGVDVYVNGRLVGNETINDEIDSFTLDVPKEMLRPGTNFIRFESDLGRPRACGETTPPTRRIEILETTTMQLRQGAALIPDLDDLPYLFRSFSDIRSTAVITPTGPTVDEAQRAVHLAILLGGRGLAPVVVTADEDAAAPTSARHLVVFGTPTRQTRLDEFASVLPLGPVVPDRWPADIEVQLEGTRHQASIQLAWTTDDDQRAVLAMIGATDRDALAAVDVVLDADLRGQLVGTMAVTSTDPLGAVAVRYTGVALTTATTAPAQSADGGPILTADSPTPAPSVAVAVGADGFSGEGGGGIDPLLFGGGIVALGGGIYAMRRFGASRAAEAT